jgi:hypothetical protein
VCCTVTAADGDAVAGNTLTTNETKRVRVGRPQIAEGSAVGGDTAGETFGIVFV